DSWREDSEGVVSWLVDEGCGAGSPADGVAMRTVTQGSGEVESRVGVQQVVVLRDADAAAVDAVRRRALGVAHARRPVRVLGRALVGRVAEVALAVRVLARAVVADVAL